MKNAAWYMVMDSWNKVVLNTPRFCMAISILLVCNNFTIGTYFWETPRNVPKENKIIALSPKIPNEECFVWQQLAPGEEGVCDRTCGIVSRASRFVERAPQPPCATRQPCPLSNMWHFEREKICSKQYPPIGILTNQTIGFLHWDLSLLTWWK